MCAPFSAREWIILKNNYIGEGIMKKIYRIEHLCCANCAAKMEKAMGKIEGVKEAKIAFMTAKLYLEFNEEQQDEVLSSVKNVVKKIEPICELKEV